MRRHFRFGADNTNQHLIYAITRDWSVYRPYWVSMPHKADVFEILSRGWGTTADAAIYVQCVRRSDSVPQPALDCPAPHFALGYEPVGGLSPLPVFLFNGFIDKDFNSTPPIWREYRRLP
jgi:hypothetical protein